MKIIKSQNYQKQITAKQGSPLDTFAANIARAILDLVKKGRPHGKWTGEQLIGPGKGNLSNMKIRFQQNWLPTGGPEIKVNGHYAITHHGIFGDHEMIGKPNETELAIDVNYNSNDVIPPRCFKDVYDGVIRAVRHELVHEKQFGDNHRLMPKFDDQGTCLDRKFRYLMQPHEIEANVESLYLSAKKKRQPMDLVIRQFIQARLAECMNRSMGAAPVEEWREYVTKAIAAYNDAAKKRYPANPMSERPVKPPIVAGTLKPESGDNMFHWTSSDGSVHGVIGAEVGKYITIYEWTSLKEHKGNTNRALQELAGDFKTTNIHVQGIGSNEQDHSWQYWVHQQQKGRVSTLYDDDSAEVSQISKKAQGQKQPKFRIDRNGMEFTAFLGNEEIGRAYLACYRPKQYYLHAIDIYDHSDDGGPNYQRQGYGTRLMQAIRKYLIGVGAELLSSSNEGSGTVQMLDKVFGRDNVVHTHGGEDVDYEQAKKIMDVDYGRTVSRVNLNKRKPK